MPKRAPFSQKLPGNCPSGRLVIGQIASVSTPFALGVGVMSSSHGFFQSCGAQSLAVCSDVIASKSHVCGVPASGLVVKFACVCGIGTAKIGIEVCPPWLGFIVI